MSKKATVILLVCGMFLFFKYLAQLFPSLIANELINFSHITGIELGLIASSYYYSYTLMQFGAGYFLDKYSAKLSAFIAILLVAIGILIFVHGHGVIVMCGGRVCMGLGAAFATILYMKCTAMWVERKLFGFISSLLATATMFGAACGGAPIAYLFAKVGWQTGLNIIACFGCVLSLFALIFISNNDANKLVKSTYNTNFLEYLKEVIKKTGNWILLFYSGVTFIPLIVLGGVWGSPFLETKLHLPTSKVSVLLSIMFVGIALGAPIWSLIEIRYKKQIKLMHMGNAIAFVAILFIIYANLNYIIMGVAFFILGAAVGVFMLSFKICRDINSLLVMGFAVAFINTGEGLIGMFLEPLIGKILDLVKSGKQFSVANYELALVVLPVCFILSSITLALLNKQLKGLDNIER